MVQDHSAHVTTAATERNWSAWGRTYTGARNAPGIETAEKLVYIKANMGDEEEDGSPGSFDELINLK